MKERPYGFLAKDKIDQNGEIFDYIRELHGYLWEYIRQIIPGAGGNLHDYVDKGLEELKNINKLTDDKLEEIEILLRLQIGL